MGIFSTIVSYQFCNKETFREERKPFDSSHKFQPLATELNKLKHATLNSIGFSWKLTHFYGRNVNTCKLLSNKFSKTFSKEKFRMYHRGVFRTSRISMVELFCDNS